jgi:hypothetical protein
VTILLYWRNTTSCEKTCSAVPIHYAAQRPSRKTNNERVQGSWRIESEDEEVMLMESYCTTMIRALATVLLRTRVPLWLSGGA